MFLSLKLDGTGTTDDPYIVDAPNYTMLAMDTTSMSAVVSMGTRDGPPHLPQQGTPLYPLQGDKYVLIGLAPDDLAAWWARLATRYPRQDPPFAPDFP